MLFVLVERKSWWFDDYLTDDVSGGDTTGLRSGIVPKPVGGTYRLTVNLPSGITGELKTYLYDALADTTPMTFTLPDPINNFEIHYASEAAGARTVIAIDLTPPPVPAPTSPDDNSHVNTSGLVLDWSDVTDPSSPVTYNYRSSWPGGGSYGPVSTGTNSYIDAPGTPDNAYEWQAQACDSAGNCSEWSHTSHLVRRQYSADGRPGLPDTGHEQ
jgi:hypothetical protein